MSGWRCYLCRAIAPVHRVDCPFRRPSDDDATANALLGVPSPHPDEPDNSEWRLLWQALRAALAATPAEAEEGRT